MKWDSRGLWYWFPAALILASFFVDQPLQLGLRGLALLVGIGITKLLRREDPSWARTSSRRGGRVASVRRQMSLRDPMESMRSMRKAFVGSMLISVRPTKDGFRVFVDAEDGSQVSESLEYPTLQSAIDAAIEEIAQRREADLGRGAT